jgi:IclR helix-turn-helix domain
VAGLLAVSIAGCVEKRGTDNWTTPQRFLVDLRRFVGRGAGMQKVTKTRIYTVPVLTHALDILEYLRERNIPLRLNEISDATGVSLTTTYRILQTLVRREYVTHDPEGRFRIQIPLAKSIDSPQLESGLGVDDQKIRSTDLK